MIDKESRYILLYEVHKAIFEAIESLFSSDLQDHSISYPPEVKLNANEISALSKLELPKTARSGLKKIIADICSYPISHFFSVLDGVEDPDLGHYDEWIGLSIDEKSDEKENPKLHEEFYSTYRLYKSTKRRFG